MAWPSKRKKSGEVVIQAAGSSDPKGFPHSFQKGLRHKHTLVYSKASPETSFVDPDGEISQTKEIPLTYTGLIEV